MTGRATRPRAKDVEVVETPATESLPIKVLSANRILTAQGEIQRLQQRYTEMVTLLLEEVADLGPGEQVEFKGIKQGEDGGFLITFTRG